MKMEWVQQPKRILIVRRDNIGDLVCTTPAFAALRRHYPNAEIGALVNSYNAEVLSGNHNVDRLFVYQKLKHASGFLSRIKALLLRVNLIIRLRHWCPDVTILAKSSYDRHGLNFARQIGAANVIGYVPDDLSEAQGLPDIRLPTPQFTFMHEVEVVNKLLSPLGIYDALGPLQVFPEPQAVAELTARFLKAPRCIALHISAREPERRWGIANFITLAKNILETQPDTQILLLWAPGKADDPYHPGDDEAVEQLVNKVHNDLLVPVVTQNLTELIAALSLSDLFIGTDGGAMHLAAALSKNILALFENQPGKLNHWYPWGARNQMVYSQNPLRPDVRWITLPQVRNALVRLGL